ncbi:unnamed protein product [Taenia asiatica]|uniref:ANTH domain-containing protein n=1 Tax=Taenia asiatica TaxID=60517 RepID=A0A0R3VT07_TAEAS|nr:unnamed protein product [Taenia asiatica]
MKTMPYAKASLSELFNNVLLCKDRIRLCVVDNEAMINIIEKPFSMSKKDCQESLRIYKAFLKRMEHVNHFIKVAEVSLLSVIIQLALMPSKHLIDCHLTFCALQACDLLQLQDGFGKQSLILKPVPTPALDTLEGHLAHLEGKKSNEFFYRSTRRLLQSPIPTKFLLSLNPSGWLTINTTSGGGSLEQKPPIITAASDLASRLAEIAGLDRPKQQQSSKGTTKPMPASALNPWAAPGGVLQPTPVNKHPLTSQDRKLRKIIFSFANDVVFDDKHGCESPFQLFNSMARLPLQAIQPFQPQYALTQCPEKSVHAQLPAFSPRPL